MSRTELGISQTAAGIKLKLIVAYDGTHYQGWQIQKIGTGVQEKLEAALAKLFSSRPCVHSSSRTDTGVHALGMVAHFEVPRLECKLSAKKMALALNAWLPPDIRVVSAARARKEFHARFDAEAKQYRYFVWNHHAMNPLIRHTTWHVPRPLDFAAMRRAAAFFPGKHDFRSFTSNPGYERGATFRTLSRCDIQRKGPLLTFIIEGDGFLYRMCRGIVGTLVQVGQKKISADKIKSILAEKSRSAAGMSAPAHGLVLWKVTYPKKPSKKQSTE